jgi:quinolinate synthase
MDAITPAHLLWVLDNLIEGRVVNRIQVDAKIAIQAEKSLSRMLAI